MSQNPKTLNWLAPKKSTLPNFIIGGAMKSGTSTLHDILNTHPKVFIPEGEIGFFDIDNILQHNDFNFYNPLGDQWISQDMTTDSAKIWDWYLSKFKDKGQFVVGEDSTTYLASRVVAERIALQESPIKLIFLLRHPTQRAYSQYFHLLRSGRAIYTFEDTLRFDPDSVLQRSMYKEQLEVYYQYIPKERIKVILFEELIKDPKSVVEEVCNFIGVDFKELDPKVLTMHSNVARLPKSISWQAFRNRMFRTFGNLHYVDALPIGPDVAQRKAPFLYRVLNKVHSVLNPLKIKKQPKIKPGTKAFLDKFFQRELSGIDEVVGQDIMSKWFPPSL